MKHPVWRGGVLRVALLGMLAVSGCQTLPDVPEQKYYRLLAEPAPGGPAQPTLLPGELVVRPLLADGVYAERAIVYSDEQQRQLQQYHYHYWLYPPTHLVQEHLAGRLRQDGVASVVRLDRPSGETAYAVSGRIARFDRIVAANHATASVALELRLEKKSRVLWRKTYAASEATADTRMVGFTTAMETALNRLYGEFFKDLRQLKPDKE